MPKKQIGQGPQIHMANVRGLQGLLDPYREIDHFTLQKVVADFLRSLVKLSEVVILPLITTHFAQAKVEKKERPSNYSVNDDIDEIALSCATHLKNAISFARLRKDAAELVNPIIVYYSLRLFVTFFTEMFLRWEEKSNHHGLSLSFDKKKWQAGSPIEECFTIRIHDAGLFQRLVDTMTILGHPSAFSWNVVPYYAQPKESLTGVSSLIDTRSNVKNILECNNASEYSYARAPSLTLKALIDCDPKEMIAPMNAELKERTLERDTHLLTLYVSAFVSSCLSRYHPVAWSRILTGGETDIYQYLKADMEQLYHFGNFVTRQTQVVLAGSKNLR